MSTQGIQHKKEWAKNYFVLHPDSRVIQIVNPTTEVVEFPALFDYTYKTNNRDNGNVEQQKRIPHLTFFSEYASLFTPRTTQVIVNEKTFTVYRVLDDLTEESFQGELWLV